MKFLIVEDNIIKNIAVGTLDLVDPTWVKSTYDTDIGWKYVQQYDVFMKPDWTNSDWEEFVQTTTTTINELQTYYTRLVASTHHMESFDEEKQDKIKEYLSSINTKISDINQHVSNVYGCLELFGEPLEVRPNLDSEV